MVSETSEFADPPVGGVIGFGIKVKLNPRGIPVADSDTGEVKLPEDRAVTVADPSALGATMMLDGETVMVKSPNPITFRVSDVE